MSNSRFALAPSHNFRPRTSHSNAPAVSNREPKLKHRLRLASAVLLHEAPVQNVVAPPHSAAGFVLIDASVDVISFNTEARHILSYPNSGETTTRSVLAEKIRSSLIAEPSTGELAFVTQFRSGRRLYFCRAFSISSLDAQPSQNKIALLLERGPASRVAFAQIAQRFNLTVREREVLEYLVQSMSNKEIARRMKISSNTVKVYLRLIMIKTGAFSRSAIIGKMMIPHPLAQH